ncbi:hypothetical protein BGZ57DRAFT_914661 [Hyaloscypha finlandica]|nr:hypothetical protein F5882DRAFT_422158 [Hyaloscypha sp. PMI_1271]KAH8749964.1 hypothetical protein BGZ57DRAFT_914661 [Hyaloscypha finlandica]
MAVFKSTILYIPLLLAGISYAQKSNPYLTYVDICPSATIAASSAKVQQCEQSVYGAVMDRSDCLPVPVASCECEWFNSWVSVCLPNICPSTGLAALQSSQGPIYCTTTGTGSATATGATVTPTSGGSTPKETGSHAAATSQAGATTTAKAGGVGALIVPISGGLLAGAVGIMALAL